MNMSLSSCEQIGLFNCSGNHSDPCWDRNKTEMALLEACINDRIEQFTRQLLPFITLVQGLLFYGTSVIVASGVTLNALSFFFVRKEKMRRSTFIIFLSVLTVYDSLALLLNFMIGVIRGHSPVVNQIFLDNQTLCKLHGVIVELFNLLSVWTIVTFTVERYIVVRFPQRAKMFTPKRILLMIGISSVGVLMFSCHKIYFTGFEGDSVFGYTGCRTDRLLLSGIIFFYVAFNTWLPTVLILVFNFAIIKAIRKHQVRRATVCSKGSRLDIKATRLLLTVSCVYLVLVLPLGAVQTIELFDSALLNATPITSPNYVDVKKLKIKLKWIRAFLFFFYQLNFANIFPVYIVSSLGAGNSFSWWAKIKQLCGFTSSPKSNGLPMPGELVARNEVEPAEIPRNDCDVFVKHEGAGSRPTQNQDDTSS